MEVIKPRPLSPKRLKWVKDVVEHGEPLQATKRVFGVTTEASAKDMTYRLTHDENVMTEVRLALDAHGVDASWIIKGHKELAMNSENDMVKTKNLEDLGELRGMYPKKAASKVDVSREGVTVQWGGEE